MSSDISSSIASIAQTSVAATPIHFDVIFKVEYVGKPNKTLKSGIQRRKQFTCRQCNPWSTPHRPNAVKHVLPFHPLSGSSQSSVSAATSQRDISSMFVPITSQNGLRIASISKPIVRPSLPCLLDVGCLSRLLNGVR